MSPLIEPLELRRLLATWYISTTGDDNSAGTLADPFNTIEHALGAAQPGDTIYLRAGRYDGNLFIDKNNLTIESYPGERATIDTPTNIPSRQVTIGYDIHVVGGTLRNLDISGGYNYTIKTESNHDEDHPAGSYVGSSNLLFENLTIHDSGQHVIKLSPESDNITIRNCEVYNSGMRDPNNGQGIDAVNTDNILIENNYVHDITQNGIYIKGGSRNGMIRNNRVENVGFSGILLGQQTDYGFFAITDNPGLFESIDSTARNNVVVNAGTAGIGTWGSKNALIEDNVIVNCATEGQAAILVNTTEHFLPPNDFQVDRTCEGVIIRNNKVSHSNFRPVVQIRVNAIVGFPTMTNNQYYRTDGAAQFWDERTVFKGTLAQWQVYTGTDVGSFEANPGLIDAAPPAEITGTSTPSQVQLSWIDQNDFTAPGASVHTYYVHRGEKPNFDPDPLNRIGITTSMAFTDSSIEAGQLYYYRLTVDNGVGQESRPSAVGRSPLASAGSLQSPATLPTLSMTFDENVGPSLQAGDLLLINLTTGLPVAATNVSFDIPSLTATFHFGAMLPDGSYRAMLVSGSVMDENADPVADGFAFDFVTASGDTSGNDTFTIRTATNGQSVEVFRNVPTTDPPTFIAPLANLAFITLQGLGGNDVFNFEGSITPRTYFNGGTGLDQVNVLSGTATFHEDSLVGSDNLAVHVAAGAAAEFNASQHLTNLSIAGIARVRSNGNLVLVTKGLTLSGTGRLALRNNDLIVDYSVMGPLASWNGSSYTSVVGMVQAGRNGGSWDGIGIFSSQASTNSNYVTLAAAEASAALGISNEQTALFSGQTVDSTSILVKFTYGGDANFDGKVNIDDYIRMDNAISIGGLNGWSNGDYNYDGKINIDDYVISDFGIGTQGPPL